MRRTDSVDAEVTSMLDSISVVEARIAEFVPEAAEVVHPEFYPRRGRAAELSGILRSRQRFLGYLEVAYERGCSAGGGRLLPGGE